MSTNVKILAFAGSSRRGSFNRRLLEVAVLGARNAGADVTVLELRDYPLPIMDQDLEQEQGTPENAKRLKQLFVEHQGLLIASPEYNSSMTPLLKNTIDWVSRPAPNEPPLVAFTGKVCGLVSASPGALGGLRALVHVRSMLGNIGVLVLPDQVAVPRAFEAFNPDGSLKDPKQQASVEAVGAKLAAVAAKLRG
jgi:chromate reductase, NAD(P)H dehydrogenase (quinone)